MLTSVSDQVFPQRYCLDELLVAACVDEGQRPARGQVQPSFYRFRCLPRLRKVAAPELLPLGWIARPLRAASLATPSGVQMEDLVYDLPLPVDF